MSNNMPRSNHRELRAEKLDDIMASASDFVLNCRFNAMIPLARHIGLTRSTLQDYVPNEVELIRQLCLNHLNAAFEAVCSPVDWCGVPIEVLRAMSLALLRYAEEKSSRHMVFLLHRQALHDPARNALDTLLRYLTNNFQLAMQGVFPDRRFDTLQSGARMLLGELMHLPLWWPDEPHIGKDEWLCHLIGLVAGTSPPDWRLPAAIRADSHGTERNDWGDTDPPNRFMV